MFNQPMVAVADVAEQNARMPVSIEPPVAVRGHWVGTRIAVLTPVEPLRPATAYKVRVPAGTPSVAGSALAADAVAEFETASPPGRP